MPYPLSDTGGAEPASPRRWGRRRRRSAPFASGRLDLGPGPLTMHESRPDGPVMFREKKRRIEVGTVFAALVALATIGLVAALVYRATRVEVVQTGIEDGSSITLYDAAALEVRFEFSSEDEAAEATLTVDGDVVEEPGVLGEIMVWRPPEPLEEGDHLIEVAVPRAVLGDSIHTWAFTVDGTPPELEVPTAVDPVAIDAAAEVSGTVEEGAQLLADGEEVDVEDGTFTLRYDRPPAGPVTIEAVDEAGNRTTAQVVVPVTYPGLRGVHVSAAAWSNEALRSGVLKLVDEGRIDTVQLDLKDDTGTVGYDSEVPLALAIGAVTPHYDLEEAVALIEERGARVVGRIAAFRDPTLVQAAWAAGDSDRVVQSVRGGPYEATGQFTNPADPTVRRYNLDIAIEAVGRGVDDILWDDVRFPTSDPDTVVVPRLTSSPSDVITGFLAEAHSELRRRGAYQGVTTVGMAAEAGDTIGQDVARVARNADYVSPQIFPGYWSSDRYGVADPPRQPGEFTRAIVGLYQQVTADTGAPLAPWLQNFEVQGHAYGEGEVRAMIDALDALEVDRFLLWSPRIQYSAGALDPVT